VILFVYILYPLALGIELCKMLIYIIVIIISYFM